MITAYTIIDNRLEKQEMNIGAAIPKGTVFIDLYEPTTKEEQYMEHMLKMNIPSRAEMDKIEVMSPFYKDGDAHYMTVTVLDESSQNDHPNGTAITCILTDDYILVLRYTTPWSLMNFIARATRGLHPCNSPEAVLGGMLESFINKTADVLEEAGNDLDNLLNAIFEKRTTQEIISSKKYNSIIRKIGYTGNLISKNRESLVSLNRLLIYFSQIGDTLNNGKREYKAKFKNLAREVHSLGEYGNFLSQRNSFLLDATLGMISVEQNMIIKVFTVASAVFMPPMLIASIYGMNFEKMPELKMFFGYPMALLMIVISALLPYFFFKKKKWL